METTNNKLLDLIKQERERRGGASNYEDWIIPSWSETAEEYKARVDGLRAAGRIGPNTKIQKMWEWQEPPFLDEVRANADKLRALGRRDDRE